MTVRDVIARLDELDEDETIYAESAAPEARAVVAAEPEDGSLPEAAAGLPYLLEVALAKEAVEVWRAWRPGRSPTLEDKLEAIAYYAENDAWLPVD
jgi:hypothetical protein